MPAACQVDIRGGGTNVSSIYLDVRTGGSGADVCMNVGRMTAVEDGAGWCACGGVLVSWIRLRDGDDQGLLGSCSAVHSAKTCPVVGYPPTTAGTARHAPRIDQLRICDATDSSRAGNKIDLRVVLAKTSGSHDQNQC